MKKIRNINLDFLKIMACIGVVLLHTTISGFKGTSSWNYLTYLYYLGTYSIPLFFMVNGYLLLGRNKISYSYILQKVKWIFITVSIWSLIIWIYKRNFSENPIRIILDSLIQKGYFFQFWFFGALIIIYLCLPILKKFLNSKNKYLLILTLLVIIGLMFELTNYLVQFPVQFYIIQTFRLWTWFFYYILGGFLAQFNLDILKKCFKSWMKVITVVLLFTSPLILFAIAKDIHHNLFAEYFYDSILVKAVSLGTFLTVLTFDLNTDKNRWIINLSNQTMGVFVTHTYIMKVWEKLVGFSFTGAHFLFVIFTLSISFIVVGILLKIPYLNRIVKL